jgi:hypothetical protein
MAPALDVADPTAAPEHEKVTPPILGRHEVAVAIHRPEDVVSRHLRVERCHQSGESRLANQGVDIALGQLRIISGWGRGEGGVPEGQDGLTGVNPTNSIA